MTRGNFSALVKLKLRSFLGRILILTTVSLVIAISGVTAYRTLNLKSQEYENSRILLGAIAENINFGITHKLIVQDYAELEQQLLQAADFPYITEITVTNSSGRIVSSVSQTGDDKPVATYDFTTLQLPDNPRPIYQWHYGENQSPSIFAFGLDATDLTLWYPIENGNLGWLYIKYSVTQVRAAAIKLIVGNLLFAVIIILLVGFVLSIFLRPIQQALQRSTDFAEDLRHMDGKQTPVYEEISEIAKLDQALNATSTLLQKQEADIIATNSLLTNVMNAATEMAIIATNREGIITIFNRGSEIMLGYQADEVINKMSPAPFHVPGEVEMRAQELSESLGYSVSGFRTFVEIAELRGSEQREWTYVSKSGNHFPVSLVVTTMRDSAGDITGYLGIAQDITERRRMDKMKSEFVSTVSHELRTPLTAISGALGLVNGGAVGQIPESAKHLVSIAHNNSIRLTHLINDLLDMEKLVAGKMHFDIKAHNVNTLLQQAIDSTITYSTERNIRLELKSSCPDAEIMTDAQRFLQIMSNLLSNAIKYSPDGEAVEIFAEVNGDDCKISVRDRGPGIPENFRNRIFGKFNQADSSDTRKKGGTGLGLAITRELVERMGGKIGFDTTSGKGTTFYFTLPSFNDVCTGETDSDSTRSLNSQRILIVEDDVDIAKLVSIMLGRAGFQTDIALNGTQALSFIERKKYTAITLDLMLPDMSGLDIIRKLRTHPETAELPVIVLSAKMEEGKLTLSSNASNIGWLSKPINEALLLSTIHRIISPENSQTLRVLHVEDNKDFHLVIRKMAGEQFEFRLAKRLVDARKILQESDFNLILLDLDLPDGSGWELVQQIRTQQPAAKIIILSGQEIHGNENQFVEVILTKSRVSQKELLDALKINISSQ